MSAKDAISEYRDTMVRIGRLASRLRSYTTDRCWIIGGLTSGAMQDAIELERRVMAALEPLGLDKHESLRAKRSADNALAAAEMGFDSVKS
jgi:hypothetical protein